MYKFDKDQLLKESQELGFEEVELDSITESLNLDAETQESLVEAITLASRKGAVELTESHLAKVVELAEAQLAEQVESIKSEFEATLNESVDQFLIAVGNDWLQENKLAVDNITKAELFDSLMESLKSTFIEHNVSFSDEQIDILEELTLEEKETRELANKYYQENQALKEELNIIKRDQLIESNSVGMTESQKETFTDLAKAMKLDESFEPRIQKLSESMVSTKKEPSAKEQAMLESLKQGSGVKTSAEVENTLLENKQGDTKTPKEEDERARLRRQM